MKLYIIPTYMTGNGNYGIIKQDLTKLPLTSPAESRMARFKKSANLQA